jgi:hypothetical protein
MGVQGWTRLMAEEGWLPPQNNSSNSNNDSPRSCCSTSLWRNPASMENSLFASRVRPIPPHSTLHMDGSGLVFYLHSVAYARHLQATAAKQNGGNGNGNGTYHTRSSETTSCSNLPSTAKLSKQQNPGQIRALLPNFIPLALIQQVTKEYVTALVQKQHLNVVVYFDGPRRRTFIMQQQENTNIDTAVHAHAVATTTPTKSPEKASFKQETDDRRQERIPEEWSLLQQYCLYGILPATETLCAWEHLFPKNRLVKTQILHTLQQYSSSGSGVHISIQHCQEEADAVMARAAHRDRQAFVVGNDSDFCFFDNINYIPFSTLDATGSVASACVIRRDELAASLNLPSDQSMVEVAIAMGNDYMTHPASAGLDCPTGNHNVGEILDYIRDRGTGFMISVDNNNNDNNNNDNMQQVLTFIRALYNLQDLEDFPFDDEEEEEVAAENDNADDDEAGDEIVNGDTNHHTHATSSSTKKKRRKKNGFRPTVPNDMDLQLVKLEPMVDLSLWNAVLRCLQAYVDQAAIHEETHSGMMTQQHIDVFRQMNLDGSNATMLQLLQDPSWRPVWDDIPASYLIERAIAMAFELNRDSPMARLSCPSAIFDQYKFHAFLCAARGGGAAGLVTPSTPLATTAPPEPLQDEEIPKEEAPPKRVVLPIDEFEDIILENIRNNRVSIIQGETGCGKSSRIPIMCLKAPPPDPALRQVKLFISQPRRIAAKALVERVRSVEPELRDAVALRMGHGVREYENKNTRAWFVTTGYLVRLMINHPEKFNSLSHLIIDEVHERSVDTDILCLLCRRLLKTNEHIRLVLMSATLAAAMYQEYFGVPEPPIKVGGRRFPVEEVYLEDLAEHLALPAKEIKNLNALIKECSSMKCQRAPSMR